MTDDASPARPGQAPWRGAFHGGGAVRADDSPARAAMIAAGIIVPRRIPKFTELCELALPDDTRILRMDPKAHIAAAKRISAPDRGDRVDESENLP